MDETPQDLEDQDPSGEGNQAEPVARVCRKCSAISETAGEFCPHCGTPYAARRRFRRRREGKPERSRKRKVLMFGLPLLLVLSAAGTGAYLKIDHDNQVAADKRAEERERRQVEKRRARQERVAAQRKKAQEELDTLLRKASVKQLEEAITKDARSRVAEGILEGPIKRTECRPSAGEDPSDPNVTTATYECIAVNTETGTQVGGPGFTGTIDFETDEIRWSLGD